MNHNTHAKKQRVEPLTPKNVICSVFKFPTKSHI